MYISFSLKGTTVAANLGWAMVQTTAQVLVNIPYLYMASVATALLPAMKPPKEYISSATIAITLRVRMLVLGMFGALAHDVTPSTPRILVVRPLAATASVADSASGGVPKIA